MHLPTYAGNFFCLHTVLYQGGLQELDRLGENGFFIVVAVLQQIVDFRANRGAGMLQIVRQEIVCGNVQGVDDHNQELKARISASGFYIADMLIIYSNNLT